MISELPSCSMILTVTLTEPLPPAATPASHPPLNLESHRSESTHRLTSFLRHCSQHGARLRGGNPGISSHVGIQRIGQPGELSYRHTRRFRMDTWPERISGTGTDVDSQGGLWGGSKIWIWRMNHLGQLGKVEGPGGRGEVGGSHGETLVGQRAREAGASHRGPEPSS